MKFSDRSYTYLHYCKVIDASSRNLYFSSSFSTQFLCANIHQNLVTIVRWEDWLHQDHPALRAPLPSALITVTIHICGLKSSKFNVLPQTIWDSPHIKNLKEFNPSSAENHLNPVMLVFIGILLLSTLRWVPICQGFSDFFSFFCINFVLAKLVTSSIRVKKSSSTCCHRPSKIAHTLRIFKCLR